MLYMVEMNMPHAERMAEWENWYHGHLRKLVSIPGIFTAQRFGASAPTASPFMAIYNIAGADVLTSAAYRAKAGPNSTGEWQHLMTNWKRNIAEGLDTFPEIAPDGTLVVWDRFSDNAPALPNGYHSLRTIGLDRSFVERGITWHAVPPQPSEDETFSVRVFKPLSGQVTAPEVGGG